MTSPKDTSILWLPEGLISYSFCASRLIKLYFDGCEHHKTRGKSFIEEIMCTIQV